MIIIELSRVCMTSGRDEGKLLLTGDTFRVTPVLRKWGKLERDICIVDNGTSTTGGYWVSESYDKIRDMIMKEMEIVLRGRT